MRNVLPVLMGSLVILLLGCAGQRISEEEVPRIDKESLVGMLGSADVIVLDVRGGPSIKAPHLKILGSVTEDPDDVAAWSDKYGKGKKIVLYCA